MKCWFHCLTAAVAFAASGAAQTLITENEFLAALDASHPALAEGAEALAVARAAAIRAAAFDDPALGLAREDPAGPVRQTDLSVSWKLPDADRRLRAASRRLEALAAEAAREQELVAVRLAMKAAYADWALAAARRERIARDADRLAELSRRERLRADRGEISGLDAHRLELASLARRAESAIASAEFERARGRALAWNPEVSPDAVPLLPPLAPPPEPARDHPRVRAAEADLDAALAATRASRRLLPSPELTVGWQQQEALLESVEGPLVGLDWSIPLFSRKRYERAVAEARVAAARARLERVRREIQTRRSAVRAASERLVSSRSELEAAVGENDRILRSAEVSFRHGERTLTDLLDTHRTALDAELALLDLIAAALEAARELEGLSAPSPPAITPPIGDQPR